MRRRAFLGGVAATATATIAATGTTAAAATATAAVGAEAEAGAGAAPDVPTVQAGWQLMPGPTVDPGARLLAVSAAGRDLAWAVGEQGLPASGTGGRPLALRWDGAAWSQTDVKHLSLNGSLRSVSGTSARCAWAVGEDRDGADRLLRWDGTTWRQTEYPGSEDPATVLTWVATGPDGAVWVAGQHEGLPKLLRRKGGTWAWTPPIPNATSATAPWRVRLGGGTDGGVYTVGDDLARWDEAGASANGASADGGKGKDKGTAKDKDKDNGVRAEGGWTVLPPVVGIRLGISDLLPTAADDIWAVGAAFGVGGPPGKPPGVVLSHFDGKEWTFVNGDTLPFKIGSLNAITDSGSSTGSARGPGLIGGWDFWDSSSAHYLRWNGTQWAGERGGANGVDAYVRDVASVPGPAGGAWSVGHSRNTSPDQTQFRIERYG